MEENGLKAICELMGQKFTIPPYQRGYRWEDQEVTELLDDLWAFQKDRDSGDFYCLQPIVLQQNKDGDYDVLDGQQRLTTLYLLLVYLEEKRKEDNYLQPLFTLNYATRKKCEEFLLKKKFSNGNIDSSNIDFFHICNAYQCIEKWFEKHSGAKGKLVSILLDKTEKGNRNVRVIRYEVEKDTNPVDVFIRLNVGKIPLTDAELTKALLLQSDKYPPDELKYNEMKLFNIASKWDIIETTLQDKAFWYFLNNKSNKKDTNIEFIFDLLANKIHADKKYFEDKPKKYATFIIFSEYLQDLINNGKDGKILSRIEAVEEIWGNLIEYFEYFNEWFTDLTLYHYIGFLIAMKGYSIIDTIIQESKKLISKSKFKIYLEQEVANTIKNKKSLNELVYENNYGGKSDYKEIKNILLLHNVFTTLKSLNEKSRFPFDLYYEQEWSLEHIYARNSQSLTDTVKQKEWLSDHIKSLSNSNNDGSYNTLINKMKEMKEQDEIDDEAFEKIEDEVYEKIEKHFEFENDENVHLIKNLCLLDKATNSQLNNSVFDVKREKIKKREIDGNYIPVCTRNVFLKAYTTYPNTNTYWTKSDRNEYFKSVQETYDYFVSKLKD
jgi:uncharacterized protein with ParB-like and HNH nuclease domain